MADDSRKNYIALNYEIRPQCHSEERFVITQHRLRGPKNHGKTMAEILRDYPQNDKIRAFRNSRYIGMGCNEEKIKIAFVYLGRKGGGPVYSLEIAKELQNKAEVFCFISKQVENKDDWEKNIKNVYFVDTYTNSFGFVLSFFRWGRLLRLKKKIKEFSPDVIYYPFFHYWLFMVNLWFPKIPKVYTAHDPILHIGEKSFLMKFLQNFLIKKSERVIILSSVFKKHIKKSQEKIDVAPHGIFNYYKDKSCNEENIEHPPTLLFFGRILDYKGIDILLKSFLLVKKELPQSRLIVAGSGDLSPYKNLISKKDGIIFENKWIKDEEVADYFLKSDVLVCPYKDASQSGAIPIAYVFKMPVIASKTGGLVEQVDNGETGILVEKENVEDLAEACIKLLSNNTKRKEMGDAGHRKAIEEWSWNRISDMVLQSLKKAINNHTTYALQPICHSEDSSPKNLGH